MPTEHAPDCCLRCGHLSCQGDRFCSLCGQRLAREAPDLTPPLGRRERKVVSVMFADIKGSTEVVNLDDPERASERLERMLDLMRNAVHRFGGTVNRVQGDGIMALFGAPVEYEDHAVRACAAALAMLDSVIRVPPEAAPALQIRVGIASGEVMTLPVVSDAATHYDAMGRVVHVAARLEKTAAPGTALISTATYEGTHGAFETLPRELTGLRGLPATPAFELVRWASERGASPQGRVPPLPGVLVGREGALTTLGGALAGLAGGRGRVVCVSGEPGVGKSRLIAEFIARAGGGVRVCASHLSPYRNFAYGPLADLVADLGGIDPETSSEHRRVRLEAMAGNKPSAPKLDAVALATLLDVDSDRSDLAALAPPDRRLRVEAAAIGLFRSISQEKPLVLVIEDVHWLDRDALSQIARVCDGIRSERCLIVFSVRDGWPGASVLLEQSDYQCHLAPLAVSEATQMLNALVHPGRGTAALGREIIERTQGNPLFIEETLHALHQLGALVREGRTYSLRQPGVEVPLSPTVRGLLAARIDRLEDTPKDVLQAVAVIGRSATPDLLRSLLNFDPPVVDDAIEQLIAADLLAVDMLAHPLDLTLRFRHPLVREVTYEQTLLRDRARIHRWMLARLEEEERGGLRDRTDILAEHALRAEAWGKAARYMLQAGNEAFWRDANTEAVRLLLQGLEAVAKTEGDANASLIALQLRLELRNPLFQLARMDELAEHLRAAGPVALELAHPLHTGRYHIFQSHYHWFVGDALRALEETEAAQALAASSGLKALADRARFQRALVHFSRGEYRDAIALMDDVSASIAKQEPQDGFGLNKSLLVTTLGYSARARAELGQIAEAREDAARSLAIARELDNQFAWVFAYVAEGWVNYRANDPERALPFLERAYDICANDDVPLMAPVAGSFLSLALLGPPNDRGSTSRTDSNRALLVAERAVSQGRDFQFGAFQPMRLAILSRALSLVGRNQEALEIAQSALDSARRQIEPASEIEALVALSQASLGGDWLAPLEGARRIAEVLQITPALMQIRQLLAKGTSD